MGNKDYNVSRFNEIIQSRLSDENWDQRIASQVIHMKKEHNKRVIQMLILPGILLTASIIGFTGSFTQPEAEFAKNENNKQPSILLKEDPQRSYDNPVNKEWIMETVFTNFK